MNGLKPIPHRAKVHSTPGTRIELSVCMKRAALLLILLGGLSLTTGCKQSDKDNFRQTADTLGQGIKNGMDTLAHKAKAGYDSLRTRSAHSADVNVTIKDDLLEVGAIRPGHAELQVRNAGSMPHNLTVVGNGLQQSFAGPIPPGETRTLPIEVSAGTYELSTDASAGKTGPHITVTVK
jgi:hypothetical protein